jgi:hypothetical protein
VVRSYNIDNWTELRKGFPSTHMLRNAPRSLEYRRVLFGGRNTSGTLYVVCQVLNLNLITCSHLISTHEVGQLLDEEMSDGERLDLENAAAVCRKFLAWNLQENGQVERGNVKAKLAEVLGRNVDGCR